MGTRQLFDPLSPTATYLDALAHRWDDLPYMSLSHLFLASFALPLFAFGGWATRVGLLERPAEHRPLLLRLAALGLSLGTLLGLGLAYLNTLDTGRAEGLSEAMRVISGLPMAFGYVGAFGLLSAVAAAPASSGPRGPGPQRAAGPDPLPDPVTGADAGVLSIRFWPLRAGKRSGGGPGCPRAGPAANRAEWALPGPLRARAARNPATLGRLWAAQNGPLRLHVQETGFSGMLLRSAAYRRPRRGARAGGSAGPHVPRGGWGWHWP